MKFAFVLLLPLGLSVGSASAEEILTFRPLSLPRPFLTDGKIDGRIEASAVEPIDDSRAIVAHDKAAPLHVFDFKTGKLAATTLGSPRFPATTATGPKWEGITRDPEGNFFVIGTHGGKTDAERAEKSFLVRFRLDSSGMVDDDSVVTWTVAPSLERIVRKLAGEAGVARRKIEGLAHRTANGRKELLIGLREPGDMVRVLRADITEASPMGGDIEIVDQAFAFKADDREGFPSQLTSLQHVPELGGCLLTTSSEDDANVFHGNMLWFVPDGPDPRPVKVATFEVAMKVEGLAVLKSERPDASTTSVDLLLTYDNDPHATKIPSRFQTARITRRAR